MSKTEYTKYTIGHMVYYVRTEFVGRLIEELERCKARGYTSTLYHMQYAEVAINTNTNQLVKFRHDIQTLIDDALGISSPCFVEQCNTY